MDQDTLRHTLSTLMQRLEAPVPPQTLQVSKCPLLRSGFDAPF